MRRIATSLALAVALVALVTPASAGAASAFGPSNTFGGTGTADGQFNHPQAAATDSSGQVFVVDAANNRIERFDSSGNFLSSANAAGDFSPQDIALDSGGNVYVSS